jgi:methyl-accepting chemotaxis protein
VTDHKVRPKRKHYLSNLSFQAHLTIYFVVLLVIGELLAGAVFYYLANREMVVTFYRAHSKIRSLWEVLLPSVVITMAVTVVVIAAAAALLLLWYSNRIAGPLSRIVKMTQAMAEGDFREVIKIRSEDQIVTLAEALNRHSDHVGQQVRELAGILSDLDGVSSGGTGRDPHVHQIIDSCRHRLKGVVHHFKVRELT